ncbi:MAG TPA: MotA/TolQ/ExbB proton channel family protein [Polyangiaceae bacterium]|nr:MotA/TolQ/ExbB proton channel family protein [Polyangiaceae bacterium]
MLRALRVEPAETKIEFDLVQLIGHASWPVKVTVVLLVLCSVGVWLIAALKLQQLARLRNSSQRFEKSAKGLGSGAALFALLGGGLDSPGARVVRELSDRGTTNLERLRAAADRAIVDERRHARSLLSPLGSIASAAPFIGLFGTVYGIMDAFVRIGAAKSAALPVVAPAIGEALISTAIGLAAAIPAVVFYNAIDKRVAELIAELEASAAEWVALIAEDKADVPIPLVSVRPPSMRAPSTSHFPPPERG